MKVSADRIPGNAPSELIMKVDFQAPARVGTQRRYFPKMPLFFWIRMMLGGIFVFAGLDKVFHPLAFAKSINNYQILPDQLVNLTAIILPWLELLLGSLLIFGVWLPGAIVLINLLLAIFFLALVFNAARGLNIDCGCFTTTTTDNPSISWYLIRDVIFLLLGGYLLYRMLIKPSAPCDEGNSEENKIEPDSPSKKQ